MLLCVIEALLFCDAIGPRARGVFGGLDLLAALVGQDAHEAANGMLLPARGRHDLGERDALGALHHRNHGRLLAPAVANWAATLRRFLRFGRGAPRGGLAGLRRLLAL